MLAHVFWLMFPGAAWSSPHTDVHIGTRRENHVRLFVGGENVLAAILKHWLGGENDPGLADRISLVRGIAYLHLQAF